MSIYIMTHKEFEPFTTLSDYKPVLVGADKNHTDEPYFKDNDFEGNISSKNPHYCELTGAYWMLKQIPDDILGLVHYRRYFLNSDNAPLTLRQATELLSEYDVILPEKMTCTFMKFPCGVKRHFINILGLEGKEAWETCARILKLKYPEMSSEFASYEKQTTSYFYNMCIMRREDFEAYHNWLFDILFQVENEIDVLSYNKYNQRMFGFLSERLLTFWCQFHQKKIKEVPILFTEPISFGEQLKQMVTRKLGV